MEKLFIGLIVLAVLILLYILWCLIEPFILDMDRAVLKKSSTKPFSSENISITKLPMNDGSASDPSFRFFFFSDTHSEWCPVTAGRICKAIRKSHEEAPFDAVIFGGDLITYPHNASLGYRYLNKVSLCCKELGIPFYGITGNHDVKLGNPSAKSGYTCIDGKTLTLVSKTTGQKAILAGLPDLGTHKLEWPKMPSIEENLPVILAVHDPDTLINLGTGRIPDFMLSGHLHGGQMKFPFRIEFRVLRKKDKLPNMGAVQGAYDINGTSVFISRGLGCGLMPFRFLSVPEATVVEICL